MAKGKSSGGARKIGRSKKKCERYRAAGRREKNKLARLEKRLRKHPNDTACAKRIQELKRGGR